MVGPSRAQDGSRAVRRIISADGDDAENLNYKRYCVLYVLSHDGVIVHFEDAQGWLMKAMSLEMRDFVQREKRGRRLL